MPYSKIPKIVNAINKGVVKAVAGKKGGMKAEVKKKYPKTPKPTGMKGRGTTSTSVAKPKSAVKVKPPAKNKPNKPDMAKLKYKESSTRGRAFSKAYLGHALDNTPRRANDSVDRFMTFQDEANLEGYIASQEAKLGRKTKIGIQKSMGIKKLKRPKGRNK